MSSIELDCGELVAGDSAEAALEENRFPDTHRGAVFFMAYVLHDERFGAFEVVRDCAMVCCCCGVTKHATPRD